MRGLQMRSAEDVELAAQQNVHLSGTDVLMTSTNQARFEANNIEMSTAWNGDMILDTAGGAVATGSMRVTGSAIESTDKTLGLRLNSARDIELLPGVGHDVVVAGGGFSVSTQGKTTISSQSIDMSVGWNEDIRMMPKGGSVKAGALGLQGGSLVSSDVMEGLSVRSGEDVAVAAGIGKDVMVSGDSVMVNSARSTAISAQKIELASGWNQEISMDAAGGFVRMGAVKVSGSRVGTDDVMHGMAVRSGEDVEVAAGLGGDVVMSGGAVSMSAVKNVEVSAGSIA